MATIQQRLDAAKAARDAAKAAITPEVEATERLLGEAVAFEAEAREAEARLRAVKLAERLAVAQGAYPDETLEVLDLEGSSPGAGTYVVRKTPAKDRATWEKAASKPNADTAKLRATLAAKCVVDFNGTVRGADPAVFEADVLAHWIEFSMVPTTVTNAALRLAGFAMEEAKS